MKDSVSRYEINKNNEFLKQLYCNLIDAGFKTALSGSVKTREFTIGKMGDPYLIMNLQTPAIKQNAKVLAKLFWHRIDEEDLCQEGYLFILDQFQKTDDIQIFRNIVSSLPLHMLYRACRHIGMPKDVAHDMVVLSNSVLLQKSVYKNPERIRAVRYYFEETAALTSNIAKDYINDVIWNEYVASTYSKCTKTLSAREKEILNKVCIQGYSMEHVAQEQKVTRTRIYQIVRNATRKSFRKLTREDREFLGVFAEIPKKL